MCFCVYVCECECTRVWCRLHSGTVSGMGSSLDRHRLLGGELEGLAPLVEAPRPCEWV